MKLALKLLRGRAGWVLLLAGLAAFSNAQDVTKLATIVTPVRIQGVSLCGPTGLAAGVARNGSVYIWRLPSGELVSQHPAEDNVRSMACSPDGKWLALGKSDGSVVIAEASGKAVRTLAVASSRIGDLAFSPDGSLLAVNVHGAPAQLWNPVRGKLVAVLKTDFSGTGSMDFSPDSALFATADDDTSVRIYDRNGNLKATYSDLLLEPFAIAFLPDSKQLVVGGADCILSILDASDGHLVRQLAKQTDPIFAVGASPNGTSLFSLHIDAARLERFTVLKWDVQSGARKELPVDGARIVGAGTTEGRKMAFFTAESDSSLTAWLLTN
jgi:WD40 repeat protein